ncbi:hypothetical protein MNBD_UNCLBAC01-518 [hydrothermal vent metagenome]|uniref:Polysaccharide pyruvyl transferase domain-containing protein n=1 Tax=hydrothermal vent metagenome TaxID=652676 RepID=A0A3B1DI89_9ZZZZ
MENQNKKVVILNDTSIACHHGCTKVMSNIRYLLNKLNMDIIDTCFCGEDWQLNDRVIRNIQKCNVVLVNGEGTLHDSQEKGLHLAKVAKYCKKVGVLAILMNTTYYNNGKEFLEYMKFFDLIFVRQSFAQKELRKHGIDSEVVPDMTFYDTVDILEDRRDIAVGFTDSVFKRLSEKLFGWVEKSEHFRYLPTLRPCDIVKWNNFGLIIRRIKYEGRNIFSFFQKYILRKNLPYQYEKRSYFFYSCESYIKEISRCELLITGRFHALCFALKTKTPFLVMHLGLNKVEGMLYDIGLNENRIIEIDALDNEMIKKFRHFESSELKKIETYTKSAVSKIEAMFEKIKKFVLENSNK